MTERISPSSSLNALPEHVSVFLLLAPKDESVQSSESQQFVALKGVRLPLLRCTSLAIHQFEPLKCALELPFVVDSKVLDHYSAGKQMALLGWCCYGHFIVRQLALLLFPIP